MKVDLRPDAEQWLKSQVAEGRFSSIDEALSAGVSLLQQVEINAQEFDDSWAKPLIDEALAEVERGEMRDWKKGDVLKELHVKYANLINADDS